LEDRILEKLSFIGQELKFDSQKKTCMSKTHTGRDFDRRKGQTEDWRQEKKRGVLGRESVKGGRRKLGSNNLTNDSLKNALERCRREAAARKAEARISLLKGLREADAWKRG